MKLVMNGQTLIENLELAEGAWPRMKGLLGRRELPADRALWIKRCGSVHTFFMQFAIDLVFVDGDMKVTKTVAGVKPGRFVWSNFRSRDVIEMGEGFLARHPLRVGDVLNVDRTLS